MVKTIYGNIEEVMTVDPSRVITCESARELSWYHPTKVWKVKTKEACKTFINNY